MLPIIGKRTFFELSRKNCVLHNIILAEGKQRQEIAPLSRTVNPY